MSNDSSGVYLEQEKLGMELLYLGPSAKDQNPRGTQATPITSTQEATKQVYHSTITGCKRPN
jgi:hypothetical protein